jgi:hypothetical protein
MKRRGEIMTWTNAYSTQFYEDFAKRYSVEQKKEHKPLKQQTLIEFAQA